MNLEQELKKAASYVQPSIKLKETTIKCMEREPQKRQILRWHPVLLAAALVIALVGTAYAAGWLPAWTEKYAEDFGNGPDQKALIEELGIPVGISDTEGGVTITAESMLFDGETAVIMLSAKRVNEEPLVPKDAEGFENLIFASGPVSETEHVMNAFRVREPVIYFKNYQPGDTVGYYFGYFTIEGKEPNEITLCMNSLSAWYNDHEEILTDDPYTEWRLTIPLQKNSSRKQLVAGEMIETDAESYMLENLYVSPLSVAAEYEVKSTRPSEKREVLESYEDGSEAAITWHEENFMQNLSLKVRLKNGEEIDMSIMIDNNGIENLMGIIEVDEEADRYRINQGGVLPRIIPLEEMDCVIICGKEYPVS